jgi:hypothetical protein
MAVNLSEFILEGKIGCVQIGSLISSQLNLELVNPQDGDIPALFSLSFEGIEFEIMVLENTIIGIQYDFSYEPERPHIFKANDHEIFLGSQTKLAGLSSFLKKANIDFAVIESETESTKIQLAASNIHFYFDGLNTHLFKASLFDRDLYETLQATHY